MRRLLLALVFVAAGLGAWAQDEGPPVVITSPDGGTTFAYGDIKARALVWDRRRQLLFAEVTFTDQRLNFGQANEDTHRFRFPGVIFDAAKKTFFAPTAHGDLIPVAAVRKTLFFSSIQVLPNAIVRVEHPRGNLTVRLEAVRPDDPALKPAPPTDPDATHSVDLRSTLH